MPLRTVNTIDNSWSLYFPHAGMILPLFKKDSRDVCVGPIVHEVPDCVIKEACSSLVGECKWSFVGPHDWDWGISVTSFAGLGYY